MSADYSYKKDATGNYQNPAVGSVINYGYQRPGFTYGYPIVRTTYQVPKTWVFDPNKQSDARICYIIATWSGTRRAGNDNFHENPLIYLDKHLAQLRILNHSLNTIVIVIPNNPKEPSEFTSYINNMSSHLNQTAIQILRRDNIGQSYGSYSDAFNSFPDFDYYIFVEDDYVPLINGFDNILIQMFDASPTCGYLCSYAHNDPPHAAISNGISSKNILSQIQAKFSYLPYADQATQTNEYSPNPQLEFSKAFLEIKTRIYDYLTHYNAPFNEAGKYILYGESHLPTLFYPIQFLEKP